MHITVFGTGYVGLVQAAAFAEAGHHVLCVDCNQSKVERLQRAEPDFYEPGLQSLVQRNLEAGRLDFTCDAKHGLSHAAVIIIAVGTPSDCNGAADISQVETVVEQIAWQAACDLTVICKSTVPVGTCDQLQVTINDIIARREVAVSVSVVSNPEFLKQGDAVNDCMKPSRVIVGTNSDCSRQLLSELYAPFCRNHNRLIFMDRRSAEMTKYASNCFLATKISFMNEMAGIAERAGADIEAVRLGMGADPRIGYQYIYPGLGYGGSCFPKDVKALAHMDRRQGGSPQLLNAVDGRNRQHLHDFFHKISSHFDHALEGRCFAVWGLAFKPGTSDMRESPAGKLMELLWNAGARVQAHDPQAIEECRRLYGEREGLLLSSNQEDVLEGSDALIICSEWSEYRAPDFELMHQHLSQPVIFDGRNLWLPDDMARYGFCYYSIGRPAVYPVDQMSD
ncbi:UDP-glucose dehydrogenase family protein [Endozoicomonadaceae bacterium StTr2]